MIPTATRVLSLSETATLLRARLGKIRVWYPFLCDNIRGRQDVCGYQLHPCGMQQDGRAFRPFYAVGDVEEFINNVLAALPSAGKEPIKPSTLLVDRSRHWRRNRFDRYGAPVAMLQHRGRALFGTAWGCVPGIVQSTGAAVPAHQPKGVTHATYYA